MEYHSSVRKKEIPLFLITWMDLESIILTEVSQRKKNTVRYHLHVKFRKARGEWQLPGAGVWDSWGGVGQGYKLAVRR